MSPFRARPPAGVRTTHLSRELGEDIEVAVQEFLQRHPQTRSPEIRAAMLVAAERVEGDSGAGGSADGRRKRVTVLLLVLGAGAALAWLALL